MPILGNVAHARLAALVNGQMGNILAAKGNPAAGDLLQAGQAVDKLRLTVAVDTGDTDDLPGMNLEGDVLHGIVLVELGGHRHIFHVQNHLEDTWPGSAGAF